MLLPLLFLLHLLLLLPLLLPLLVVRACFLLVAYLWSRCLVLLVLDVTVIAAICCFSSNCKYGFCSSSYRSVLVDTYLLSLLELLLLHQLRVPVGRAAARCSSSSLGVMCVPASIPSKSSCPSFQSGSGIPKIWGSPAPRLSKHIWH